MSDVRRRVASSPGWLRSCAAFVTVGIALVFIQPVGHAQTDALSFFKNYFITGDYVVGGVGLRGLGGAAGVPGIARGSIAISGVPAKADIVAAFLYWQVVSKNTLGPDSGSAGAKFEGFPLTSSSGPLAKVLVSDGTAPCWSSGGSTGSANGQIRTYTYRADVLRFLPADASGNLVVNGAHSVEIPDSGGNTVPTALGASLVVVYRDPSLPLNAIVIYDGGYTVDNSTGSMTQTIRGFYQADAPSAKSSPKLTHIVGSGQANKSERLLLPGLAPVINPFNASTGNNWDNPTFPVTLSPNDSTATTSVDHVGFPSFDCLSWGAIILKTPVKDSDGDGLLDVWESATAPVTDPNGRPLPNLAAMGADKDHKDLFVEIGYMRAAEGTTYGGVAKPEHSHLPDEIALNAMGDAFKNNGINVHFDVGNNYQDSPYVIPADRARGGEVIDETVTSCTRGALDPPWVCQFSGYPGTVGWKTGFKFLRDQLVNTPPPLNADGSDPCDSPTADDGPGAACERRFDRNRQDIFHYVLFAHAVGLPKAACLNADGSSDDQCQATNPDFHAPRTNSGVADVPGGDLMVALGAFPDVSGKPVGTPFMQGATLMHELGHNFELTHAGSPQIPAEPNCKPNYMSVMNYLFQLRGLFNDVDAGVPHMDYSGEALGGIDESSPGDGFLFGGARYRSGWYAPQGPATIGTPARGYCNGNAFPNPPPAPMVRVDATSVLGPIDWNLAPSLSSAQDLNFDGTISSPLNAGSNDWINLHLGQVAARRNVGGLFLDAAGNLILGPLSLDVGRGDIGRGDIGRGDIGRGDIGRGDIGRGDIGRGDIGRGDIGRGDIGRGDIGEAAEEIDSAIATAGGNTPPTQFTACVIGIGGCPGNTASPAQNHRVRTAWRPPNVGTVAQYQVFRFRTDDPGQVKTLVGSVPATLGTTDYTLIDSQELPNAQFTYFVVAVFNDGPPSTVSGPSNFVTILAVNDAPVAVNDPNASGGRYATNQGTPLLVAAPGVLGNDTDDDSPMLTAKLVSGPANGTVTLNADGSFTYTPKAGFVGSDSFTYTANDVDTTRSSNVATVSITVKGFTVILSPLKTPAQQGSAVPIIWQLKDADGNLISSLSTLLKMESVFNGPAPASGCVASATGVRETLFSLPNGATGSSSFRFVSPGYQFNWDTTTTSTAPTITGKGCYTVLIYLNDRPDLTNPRMTNAVQLK